MKEKKYIPKQHNEKALSGITLALIIVNTNAYVEMKSRKKISLKTIPKLKRLLKDNLSISLSFTKIIPDSEEHINKVLVDLMKDSKIDSIIFSDGIGLSPEDIVYETIETHLEKKLMDSESSLDFFPTMKLEPLLCYLERLSVS